MVSSPGYDLSGLLTAPLRVKHLDRWLSRVLVYLGRPGRFVLGTRIMAVLISTQSAGLAVDFAPSPVGGLIEDQVIRVRTGTLGRADTGRSERRDTP